MNYSVTNELLELINPYTENSSITISTKNKNYLGEEYDSDFVSIDAEHYFCFEVLEGEIIVSYLTDHVHFSNIYNDDDEDECDYVQQAKDFLKCIFEMEIEQISTYKGKTLIREKYESVYPDGHRECISGSIIYSPLKTLMPFRKERVEVVLWKFDVSKGCFCEYPKI